MNITTNAATPASPALPITSTVSAVMLAIDNSEMTQASPLFNPATTPSPRSTTSVSISGEDHTIESLQSNKRDDIVMEDATSTPSALLEPQSNNDLPAWLALTIPYLRGVSEDAAWQDLVTGFVDFKKRRPPHGVGSFLHVYSLKLT